MFHSKNKVTLFCAVIFLAGVFASNILAQNGMSNARSVAMSGAYTALARGIEAPGWNPANLGLSSKRTYRLNLVSVGIGIHNNSFSKSHYDLYNGKHLTAADKKDLLSAIPAEGLLFDLDTEVQLLGINVGAFAFTATGIATSDFSLSKDVFELALYGNEFERIYEFTDSNGEGYGYTSFAVSGGFPIHLPLPLLKEFSVGVSAKYLKGIAYATVDDATSTFTTDIDGMHGTGRLVIDHARGGGSGFGLDIGAAGKLTNNLTVGLSISNIINGIKWSKDIERSTFTFRADSISVQKISANDIDSVIVNNDETVDLKPFSTRLPSELRLGVARTGNLLTLGFSMAQGFKSGPGVSTKPRIAIGSELRLLSFFPVRAGVAFGGKHGISSSVGFAFDFAAFSWDFALASKGQMTGGRGLGFAFNWMFRM